ncbi:MAG TPA: hypothetical protein VMT55_01730 [Candidatus Sulfotelmatobacter sp.]|nr:hypothetical protein [Candidatus Sulfotelmatobacter sp.]
MARALDIEAAVALAEVQTGTHKTGAQRIALVAKKRNRSRFWTKAEEDFLRENYGRLSETEIGRRLGRTQPSIENHVKRELHLTAPSKDPRILTAEHVAMGIGVDGKTVHMLCDRGILPARRQAAARAKPGYERAIRLVDRMLFMKWLLLPAHWIYFKPERVGKMIRRGKRAYTEIYDHKFWDQAAVALARAKRKWKDKWLNSTQAARILKCNRRSINRGIHARTLKATRWGNWWILRSNLPKTGTIDATGKWVARILTNQERGRIQIKKFWSDVYAGRRPWPKMGGHNKLVKERDWFFELLEKKKSALRIAEILGVSNPTVYKWLKERYGKNWQSHCPFSREFKKARFLELFDQGLSIKKAAAGAGVAPESCYRWVPKIYGKAWRKKRGSQRTS